MDFTREPIIETIITPKEGCKLVIRSSKNAGQEEYFVDAVEIIAFGNALFFRSLERPKSFLVPVSDYEVLEVREARMVLKNVGLERSIKIGGGRDGGAKPGREIEKPPVIVREREEEEEREEQEEGAVRQGEAPAEGRLEGRLDKKSGRRRNYRKRRGRDEREEEPKEEAGEVSVPSLEDEKIDISAPERGEEQSQEPATPLSPSILSSLLQPPPTLISETINRYRQNEMFKGAFYLTEEEQYKPHDKVQDLLNEDDEEDGAPLLEEPMYVQEEAAHELAGTSPSEEAGEKPPEPEQKRVGPPPIPPELIRIKNIEAALPLFAEEEGGLEKGDDNDRKFIPEESPENDSEKEPS